MLDPGPALAPDADQNLHLNKISPGDSCEN